ncbi:MAG: hypothetical protein ABR589_09160, partial [Chthoniobacterales bacterium]
ADDLVLGRVIAIKGTLDKREETIRATAQKVKALKADTASDAPANGTSLQTNGHVPRSLVLRFSPAATSTELQQVREILGTSPGSTAVQIVIERADGEVVRIDAGADLRVDTTPELKQRLAPWL